MSLSDYLIGEIRQVAERSTLEEMLARLKSQPPVELDISPADVIRAERDGLADSL